MSKIEMAKQTVVAVATTLAISGAIVECRAASGLRLTCSGNLTNTREDGITLGQCDLNSLPVKDIGSIEDICGIPGTIDTPTETKCRIKATVSPQTSRAADHRELYRVLDVLTVDKRWTELNEIGLGEMAYTVTGDTLGLAIGPVSETANDVREALRKARQLYETGMVNVSIKDDGGRKIEGDELVACITGKKTITDDLQAQ